MDFGVLLSEIHVANVLDINWGRIKVIDQIGQPFLQKVHDNQSHNEEMSNDNVLAATLKKERG